jgi:hypothetical protein
LAALAARAFARFAASRALAAPDIFRFGALPAFFSAWNAAQRFLCAAAILHP